MTKLLIGWHVLILNVKLSNFLADIYVSKDQIHICAKVDLTPALTQLKGVYFSLRIGPSSTISIFDTFISDYLATTDCNILVNAIEK